MTQSTSSTVCVCVQVLRPYSYISNLKVWDFYTEETLSEGPSFDWELVRGRQERLAEEAPPDKPDTSGPKSQRRIVWPCYDSRSRVVPDAITKLLQVSGWNAHQHTQTHAHTLQVYLGVCVRGPPQDMQGLEAELGQVSDKWKETWDKIKNSQRAEAKLESKVRPPAGRPAPNPPGVHHPAPSRHNPATAVICCPLVAMCYITDCVFLHLSIGRASCREGV